MLHNTNKIKGILFDMDGTVLDSEGLFDAAQIKLLNEWFDSKKIKKNNIREPGGNYISEIIRTVLLNKDYEINSFSETLLFLASRTQLVDEVILPAHKKDEFVIYQGSHGDRGAEIADVILPSSAYTEKDGHYVNLEGRIQKGFKASYPPGEAKEDWEIVNDLSLLIKKKKLYNSKEELIDSMKNYIKLKNSEKNNQLHDTEFFSEKIIIDPIDYYYSNVIARSSHTMSKCRNEKLKIKSAGTDG